MGSDEDEEEMNVKAKGGISPPLGSEAGGFRAYSLLIGATGVVEEGGYD